MNENENTNTKTIEISFQKAAAIIIGAVLASIGGTAITIVSIANTDHFAISSNSNRILALEQDNSNTKSADARQDIEIAVIKTQLTSIATGQQDIAKSQLDILSAIRGTK